MTFSLLNKERNPGHSGIVTGWNGGRWKKSNDWPIDPSRQNALFPLEKFGKESSVWDRSRQEKDADLQPPPEKVSRKKTRTESLGRSQQKKTPIQPIPGMSLARKKERKEREH